MVNFADIASRQSYRLKERPHYQQLGEGATTTFAKMSSRSYASNAPLIRARRFKQSLGVDPDYALNVEMNKLLSDNQYIAAKNGSVDTLRGMYSKLKPIYSRHYGALTQFRAPGKVGRIVRSGALVPKEKKQQQRQPMSEADRAELRRRVYGRVVRDRDKRRGGGGGGGTSPDNPSRHSRIDPRFSQSNTSDSRLHHQGPSAPPKEDQGKHRQVVTRRLFGDDGEKTKKKSSDGLKPWQRLKQRKGGGK